MVADERTTLEQLFLTEVAERLSELSRSILASESPESAATELRRSMRTTHALKGAGGMLGYSGFVTVAHAFESHFEWVVARGTAPTREEIDLQLAVVDTMTELYQLDPELLSGGVGRAAECVERIQQMLSKIHTAPAATMAAQSVVSSSPVTQGEMLTAELHTDRVADESAQPERTTDAPRGGTVGGSFIAVRGEVIESLVNQGAEQLVGGKQILSMLNGLQARVSRNRVQGIIDSVVLETIEHLQSRAEELVRLSEQIYDSSLRCKHRPFQEVGISLQRVVRETALTLQKSVHCEIDGGATLVDRELLRLLEEPLGHILRNAVDHGIENATAREAAGKSPQGRIQLRVRPSLGWLRIEVEDDGAGIDLAQVRASIVRQRLSTEEVVAQMTDAELYTFLFLPRFSTREVATTVSGRGVGLDAVHSQIVALGGEVRVESICGRSTTLTLRVPLRRSVQSCLILESGAEQYALPISKVVTVINEGDAQIESVSGHQMLRWAGALVPTIELTEVLRQHAGETRDGRRCVVVQEGDELFGLLTNASMEYQELSIQSLEEALGKGAEVRGAAINDRGAVIVVLEAAVLLSKARSSVSNRTTKVHQASAAASEKRRVLVVDDSLTVRELERKILVDNGYEVLVANDGLEGWNLLRRSDVELIVTDVDMPGMNGFELVQNIRNNPQLKELPVVIVSYKEREEDRRRGLEVGADRYLTKGSFHDSTFLNAIRELLG